jgi:hypothetical protein
MPDERDHCAKLLGVTGVDAEARELARLLRVPEWIEEEKKPALAIIIQHSQLIICAIALSAKPTNVPEGHQTEV